ncbi:MAG: YerC/YecD family TrpR-related protein [Patescibacteria group bacterium]
MAKFSKKSKLENNKSQELVADLCEAISLTSNRQEAAELLTDLLGQQELEMIAKRLRIAELLLDDLTYEDITMELKASPNTIARVQAWLQQAGEGYRQIIEKTKSKRKNFQASSDFGGWRNLKKKYPIYFWPQLLLEQWVKSSNEKDKQRMKGILSKLQEKKGMYKELNALLQEDFKINKV